MNRYTLVLSAAVLTALSFGAPADARADAQQQVALHTAMGAQARGSKDFGTGAHCAQLVQKSRAAAEAEAEADAGQPQDHAALAAQAEKNAEMHRAMQAFASTHRDPGMGAHCRQQIDKYTAEAAAQRALAQATH